MRKAFCLTILFSSFLPANSFLVDTSITYSPAHSYQWMCDMTFDGANFFVVWSDMRHYYFPYIDPDTPGDIFGARVDVNGNLIDTGGIAISLAPNPQHYPKVCYGDSMNFIVWEDQRNGIGTWDIFGARVSIDGMVLDPDGIAISSTSYNEHSPSIAFDGANFFVVWYDERSGNRDIYGTRITPAGIVLDTTGIQITSHPASNLRPSLCFNGDVYLVTYDDQRNGGLNSDIYATRVTTQGIVLDTNGFPVTNDPSDQWMSDIIFEGGCFFVVWMDERSPSGIYGARIIADTVLLDPNGIAIATSPPVTRWAPKAAFDGENYLVVYDDGRGSFLTFVDIYGTRVTTEGIVLDTTGFAISIAPEFQEFPAVVYGNGGLYLVAWQDRRSAVYHMGGPQIYGTCVTPDTIVLNPEGKVISLVPNPQMSSSSAFDGDNFLIVWHDERSDHDIYGIRMTRDGQIIDSVNFSISTEIDAQFVPAVAFGDSIYLCVWQDYFDTFMGLTHIHGVRINKNGILLDTIIHIWGDSTNRSSDPAVTFGFNYFFVVWGGRVRAARINQNGIIIDTTGIYISTGNTPAVTFDGTSYFVTWERDLTIYGVRVDSNGVVSPSILISSSHGSQPAVSSCGINSLVVWEDNRNSNYDIYGARVSSNGILLDTSGIAIAVASGDQLAPGVVFNGTNYIVAWVDNRNGFWYDIYGAKVDTCGNILENFTISTQSFLQIEPCLTRGPGDTVLITYSGWADSINSHPAKTMRIWGIFCPVMGITEKRGKRIYNSGSWLRASPNPFTESIELQFQVPNTKSEIILNIYDVSGRLVKSFPSLRSKAQPTMRVTWHGEDDIQKQLSAGIYFLKLKINAVTQTQKIIRLRR